MNEESGSIEVEDIRKSILVVEDDPTNQKIVRLMLGRLNIDPKIASRGAEAIEVAGEEQFDLILMDLHMPGMDGVEAARRIRDKLGEDCPPIVALTADVFYGKEIASQFSGYILKPISANTLSECIREHTTSG